MMKIVIAVDKFKDSLSAGEVAQNLAIGLHQADPTLHVTLVPIADGGEGTLDAALASGFAQREALVVGPTGLPLVAAYGYRSSDRTAVIELARASGLAVLPGGKKSPLRASSRGTGELIRAALDEGATTIIVGVGGSACTDGGAGMLAALGVRFLDWKGLDLPDGGGALPELEHIVLQGIDPRVQTTKFILASDVENQLLGAQGAASIFGPQKGASSEDIALLEQGLGTLVAVMNTSIMQVDVDLAQLPGSGAAGGVGFGALSVLQAQRRSGVDVVLEFVNLGREVADATWIITGEGSLDVQSLAGKAPVGVAALGAQYEVPVIAVCGVNSLDASQIAQAGFHSVHALSSLESDQQRSITQAARLLQDIGAYIGSNVK